jgi:glutathione S-transferase
MGRNMMLRRLDLPADHPIARSQRARLELLLDTLDKRLGEVSHLAGRFSTADIMLFFSLTTMRYFMPLDLAPWPNIRAYLKRVSAREAYQRAMHKGDPGMALLLD